MFHSILINRNITKKCFWSSLNLIRNDGQKRYKQPQRPQDPNEIANMDEYQFANDKYQMKRPKSIYCWGSSNTGALGRAVHLIRYDKGWNSAKMITKTMIKTPQRLRFVDSRCHVYDVAAGSGFTVIAATYDGTSHILFGCGLNSDAQIGHQMNKKSSALSCVAEPSPINLPIDLNTNHNIAEKVIKVACGRAHTVCLTNYANVFTMGNNSFGQCGRRIFESEKYFITARINRIDYDQSDPIIDVCCGLDHTMLLTKSGTVYTFGWGSDGQLGNGSYLRRWRLSKVIGDAANEKIVKISASGDTVLAINDKGQLFGWGNNEYGQLFDSKSDNALIAEHELQINTSKYLNNEKYSMGKIIDVAASGSMCAALNESGSVFVWGFGILGLGPNKHSSSTPIQLNPNLFGRNVLNCDIKVVKIFAGLQQFGAINDKGELYIWGKNVGSNLGIGTHDDCMFPYRVSLPVKVLKLSFGHDHTVALGQGLI